MIDLNHLFEIAKARFECKNYLEAENLFLQIHSMKPDDSVARHYLAQIALESKNYERALELYTTIHEKSADDATTMLNMAKSYIGIEEYDNAHVCLDRVQVLEPNNLQLHLLLSQLYYLTRRFTLAMQSACHAVSLDANEPRGHSLLADALLELGEFEKTIECYQVALKLRPDDWKDVANLGIAMQRTGNFLGAKDMLTLANALRPLQPEVLLPLTSTLLDLHQFSQADMIIDKLMAMQPKNEELLFYKGVSAYRQGNTKDAVLALVQSLSKDDSKMEVCYFLGAALTKEGKIDSAIELYTKMIEDKKELPFAYSQKSEILLLQGKVTEAKATINALQTFLSPDFPSIAEYDFCNKHVLLYSQFSMETFNVLVRFAHLLREKGAIVHIQCAQPNHELVARMDKEFKTYLPNQAPQKVDIAVPLESLLTLSKPSSTDIPYFIPNVALQEDWVKKFSSISKLKIGVMWRKETHTAKDVYNSVPLDALSSLFDNESVQWVCLQTNTGIEELETFSKIEQLEMVGLENSNLDERLACISSLDLLITPDCFTAQVAAGAGVPVWIMISKIPAWYYGLEGDTTAWYPSAKLYRQKEFGSWSPVVKEIESAVKDLLQTT